MATQGYSWENLKIDDTLLANFLKQGYTAIDPYADLGVGAQDANAAYSMVNKVKSYFDEKWNTEVQRLQAIDPYFDPSKYVNPDYLLYNPGEGASSNRNAPIKMATDELRAKAAALEQAQKAAQKFQQTGQFDPYPDYKSGLEQQLRQAESYLSMYPNNKDYQTLTSKLRNLISGTPITADVMAQANASAARVGAPLPYPQGSIGVIAPGGVFQDGRSARDAYDANGQLNQTGKNILASNSAANLPAAQQNATKLGLTTNTNTSANTATAASNVSGSSGAMALIKQALTSGDLNNLQNNSWWANSPYKKEAYSILTAAFRSPQGVAQLVQQTGITDLQNKSWWSNYSGKQDAWNIIQNAQQAGTSTQSGTTSNIGSSGNTASNQTTNTATGANSMQAAMDIINNSGLDDGVKALFNEVLQGWDPSKEVNVQNVLDQFNQIKSSTIDPYFAEQARIFTDSIKSTEAYANTQRQQELESEGMQANQNIKNAQNDLEARGMTFSGQAAENLGNDSAYGETGQNPSSMIPTQNQFYQFGQQGEGKVQAQNRLMSSSSYARYQKNLADLSRQAEQTLGSQASSGLVPGVTQMGNISGSLPQQQTQAYSNALSNLYTQATDNTKQNQQINLFQ